MDAARNHLIITRDLILKGTIDPVAGRLSDHLRNYGGSMLPVFHAQATWLPGGLEQELPQVAVAIRRILLAHEYVDMSGDPHMQAMNASGVGRRYRIVIADLPGLILLGALKSPPTGREGFLILDQPEVHDQGDAPTEVADAVRGLPYLIVNERVIEAYYAV